MTILKSTKVYEESQSYIGINVPVDADSGSHAEAIAELDVFRKNYYGSEYSDVEIETQNNDDGSTDYRFKIVYTRSGTDLHPGIYPDAVYATDLIQRS